ncbi:MAG: cell division protein ZapA [Prevotella sp.]|nr:cell division protein ZapA [Prevotella sp.]MBR6086563.1 cell division protein ZapA [Prevotella sp.]
MDSQQNNNTQHITIHVYDMPIDIMVPKDQEALYREAGTLINERLNTYFSYFKGQRADKEIIYYAMIDIALKYVMESKRNDMEPVTTVLDELSAEIQKAMK